ncbi:Hypothetical predicted protein, partial [Pelobates cultripes]
SALFVPNSDTAVASMPPRPPLPPPLHNLTWNDRRSSPPNDAHEPGAHTIITPPLQ